MAVICSEYSHFFRTITNQHSNKSCTFNKIEQGNNVMVLNNLVVLKQ